jgi:hypothetical protein
MNSSLGLQRKKDGYLINSRIEANNEKKDGCVTNSRSEF